MASSENSAPDYTWLAATPLLLPVAGFVGLGILGAALLAGLTSGGGIDHLKAAVAKERAKLFLSTPALEDDQEAASRGYRTWKFDAGDSHVKVRHPFGTEKAVERVLAQYPPGRASLAQVNHALDAIDAKFANWDDGTPGWQHVYNQSSRPAHKSWVKPQVPGAPLAFENLEIGEHFRTKGGRGWYQRNDYDKFIDSEGNSHDADNMNMHVERVDVPDDEQVTIFWKHAP